MPIQSDVNNLNAPFPVVDADPHFNRVLRNLRTQDYVLWGGATAFAPGALYGMGASDSPTSSPEGRSPLTTLLARAPPPPAELADPTRTSRAAMRTSLRLATWLGFAGGFLLAYQNASRASLVCPPRALSRLYLLLTRAPLAPPPQPPPSISLDALFAPTAVRLWGWKENSAEQAQDKAELTQLAKEGKPLYGESDLPEYIQGVAHRNSMWSQLKFGVMPWFNFVKCVGPLSLLAW